MLTQIYEITSPTEARSLSLIGVDHVGVLVGDGRFPREQPLSAATEIAATILPPSKLSALFLCSDLELIVQWATELRPAILHLGAAAELVSARDVTELKQRLPGS